MVQASQDFDVHVRQHVYDITLHRGYPPSLQGISVSLAAPLPDVRAALQRLAEAHVFVLQPENGEILMANPFSAVPTVFKVELDTFTCFGTCIWDALGIPVMLRKDAQIKTACGDCGIALNLSVVDGSLQAPPGIVHFALPAQRWWKDIVFT